MVGKRRRRWTNIEPALDQCTVTTVQNQPATDTCGAHPAVQSQTAVTGH